MQCEACNQKSRLGYRRDLAGGDFQRENRQERSRW